MKSNLVDLFTFSAELGRMMLNRYILSDHNPKPDYMVDRSNYPPLLSYYNLPQQGLFKFLDLIDCGLSKSIEYEIRDSQSGRYLRIRTSGLIIDDEDLIELELNSRE